MLALNKQERYLKKAMQASAPTNICLLGSSVVVCIITMYVCIASITWSLDSSKLEAVSNALLLIWCSVSLQEPGRPWVPVPGWISGPHRPWFVCCSEVLSYTARTAASRFAPSIFSQKNNIGYLQSWLILFVKNNDGLTDRGAHFIFLQLYYPLEISFNMSIFCLKTIIFSITSTYPENICLPLW